MKILFLLAALAHSSGADSNRVLSDIPFGSAKSHIRPSGVRLNRLWFNVSIPNVHYATDDEIWGSEFPIDTGLFSKKEQLTDLATGQGTTVKGFCKCSKPEETNTRSLPQQEAHLRCETQRNLLEKYVTMSDNYREPHDEVLHDNYMLPATYADGYGDEANKKFGCKTLKDYLNRYRDSTGWMGTTTIPKTVFDLLKELLEERIDTLLQLDDDADQRASRHRVFDEQLLDTYSLCMKQRNSLCKDSAFVGSFGNSKVLATDLNEYEGHENRGSTPLQITGNEIVLEARGSYSPHTLNTTTLQQGELSILIIDECGPQLPVTDFRYLHELHEFTSAASHIGLTFLHGICLRNTFDYDRPERTVHAMQLELDERDQKLNDQQREPDKLRALQKKVITRTTRTIRGECREACQSCMPT